MRIYHNIPALTAYNSLNQTNSAMEKTIQKLSTGLRINSAADDAAGFAISEKMRAQISGLEVAIRNTQDATSMLQVAEGALGETNAMLQRMRELAVQASNDTLTSQDRSYIQLEIDQLQDQIDRIAKTTQFNKKRLLDGSSAGITSSSNQSVKVYVRGSLREIDQFGQKKSFEGNYKITVNVDPSQTGSGQVQKSSVMTIKHPNVITDKVVDYGIKDVTVDSLPAGDYSVTRGAGTPSATWAEFDFASASTTSDEKAAESTAIQDALSIEFGNNAKINTKAAGAKIKFTVSGAPTTTAGSEALTLDAEVTFADGSTATQTGITLDTNTTEVNLGTALGLSDTDEDVKITLDSTKLADLVSKLQDTTEFAYDLKGSSVLKFADSKFVSGNAAATDETIEAEKTAIQDNIALTLDTGSATLADGAANAKIAFTVTAVDTTNNKVTLSATATLADGTTITRDGIELDGTVTAATQVDLGVDLGLSTTATDCQITYTADNVTALLAAVNADTEFTYSMEGNAGHKLTGFYNSGSASNEDALDVITFGGDESQTANASVLFEVTSIDKTNGTVTLRATSNVLGTDGNVANYLEDSIIVGTTEKSFGEKLGLGSDDACKLSLDADNIANLEVGTKFVYNYSATGTAHNISAIQDENWPSKWGEDGDNVTCDDKGSYTDGNSVTFALDATTYDLNSKEIHFRNFYINGDNGDVYEGDVILTTKDTYSTDIAKAEDGDKLASFTAAYIGKTATLDTKLRDLNTFWNSSGVFMLETPKTITIRQGDGKSATVTLYGTDTIRELQAKFNYAIGTELGQGQYVDGSGASKFCTFVEKGGEDSQGLETVPGTFMFRSVLPGTGGELSFSSDDEDLINTFALNEVKGSSTTAFRASIYDAHTGIAIEGATNVKVSDNKLVGVLHPNVDIEFDPTANIKAVWSDAEKNFILSPDDSTYEAIIHIVDSSTVFQIGANEGEDIAIDIGNMSAGSLGVTNINVTTREAASKSIGLIDAAISKVSAQRAKIGAYQNALDYTSENLTTTMTNLTAAESRIRDADMAQTMMEFVKLQILNQSGTSMLAQANQLPQSVLSLLNG